MNNTINLNQNFSNINIPIQTIDLKELACFQLSEHIIKLGIVSILLYIIYTWLSYYFFTKWYKYIKYDKNNFISRFIGNLEDRERRLYWDFFIRDRFTKIFMGIVIVVIYFVWKG